MSGNYVQRGEPALLEKHARAEAALACGADLVLDLPTPWALAGAQGFAEGAVALLQALGCVDTLSFGSESGDTEAIQSAARAIESKAVRDLIQPAMARGITFAAAREQAVRAVDPRAGALLRSPNDTLAVEYVRALHQLQSSMEPFAVRRIGAPHDSCGASDASDAPLNASQIRARILAGEDVSPLLPDASATVLQREFAAGRAPVSIINLGTAILCRLRGMTPEEFAQVPDISEGLENRIAAAAKEAVCLEELYGRVKTKRYPHARIRRIVCCAFLGIGVRARGESPPCLRVLGLNGRGRELLRIAKKRGSLPVVLRAADIRGLDTRARELFALECRATDIYGLAMPSPQPGGTEYTLSPVVLPGGRA